MTYGELKSYDDFKKAFTELLWDRTQQSEIRCWVYQDQFNCRSVESLSKHYVRYANMASILSQVMSDLDLLGAMITHYEPRIQNCLISANLKSTQDALAFLTKLQSLEYSREQHRSAQRGFEHQDQNRRALRDQPMRQHRESQTWGHRSVRNPQTSKGRRSFYSGWGRLTMALTHN